MAVTTVSSCVRSCLPAAPARYHMERRVGDEPWCPFRRTWPRLACAPARPYARWVRVVPGARTASSPPSSEWAPGAGCTDRRLPHRTEDPVTPGRSRGRPPDRSEFLVKRTYQPKARRRSRKHGFRHRMSDRAGQAIIKARRRKGRHRLSA